ncbi:DNA polymerase III subunit beta [Mesorhizobium sp. M6A.T.Cr.TU.017.01.1.1]|nr:DNA polymerase III subunit beta [Mesorhizobium sp. M6A.T.Cr.TU.017.01.1.1]
MMHTDVCKRSMRTAMLEHTHAHTDEATASKSGGKAAAKAAKAGPAFSVDVDAAPFRRALSALMPYSEPRNTIPILGCVTISMDAPAQRLGVSLFDIDMAIETTLPALSSFGSGDAFAVPLRTLAAFMNGADGEVVEIRKAATDERVTFTCGDFSAAIIPMPADEAPRLTGPKFSDAGFRRIPLAEGVMSWLLGLTLPFVSTEETRYYLNGVAFEFGVDDDGMLRAIATDGHRLGSRQTKTTANIVGRPTVIIPRAAIKAVAHLAAGKEVVLSVDDMKAELSFGDTVIRTKLIDGTFPDWRRVVPKGPFKEFELDAGKIGRLHRASGGVRRERGVAVKVKPCEGGMSVSANNPEFGEVSAVFRGETPEGVDAFGVNSRYFADMAKAFGAKRIRLGFTGSGDPLMVNVSGGPAGEFAVLMPMRV